MKKKVWISGLLGLSMAVSIVGLAACAPTVESISVSGGNVEYVVGETFSKEGVTVTATMSNGTTQDVTAESTISSESANLEVAGDYTITVTYGEFQTDYTIKVIPIDEIELTTKTVTKEYYIGDTISYDGLEITAYYGTDGEREVTLEDCTVALTDADGKAVSGAFEALGDYTVTVTYYGQSASYSVSVNNEVAIRRAVEQGVKNAGLVKGGTEAMTINSETSNYTYEFGDNYLHIQEIFGVDNVNDFHLAIDPDTKQIFALKEYNGVLDTTSNITAEYAGRDAKSVMNGVPFDSLFYGNSDLMVNGVDSLVQLLYEIGTGTSATHSGIFKAYHYTSDVKDGVYSFAFGIVAPYGSSNYYYEVEVSFSLDQAGFIKNATVTTYQYLSPLSDPSESGGYYLVDKDGKLVTDAKNAVDAITKGSHDFKYCATVSQEAGTRNAECKYPLQASKIYLQSLTLKDESGKVYQDGETIYGSIDKNGSYPTFTLDIVVPEGANLNLERISAEPFFNDVVTGVVNKETMKFTIYFRGHGTQEIVLYTGESLEDARFTFHLTAVVEGFAPSTFTPQTKRADEKEYTQTDEITVFVGDKLSVAALVDAYAYPGFAATVNSESATLDRLNVEDDTSDYVFSADEVGIYTITFTSEKILSDGSKPAVSKTLVVTVMEIPDMSKVISGDYSAEGYTFTFTASAENALSGKLVVTHADQPEFKETFQYVYDKETKTFTTFEFVEAESTTSMEAQTRVVFGLSIDSQYRVCYENARREKIVLNRPVNTEEIANVLSGQYEFSFIGMIDTVTFTPDQAGALSGKVTVAGAINPETFAYSYNVSTGEIICTGNTKCHGFVYKDGKLYYVTTSDVELEMTKKEVDLTPVINALSGQYTFKSVYGECAAEFHPASEGAVNGTIGFTGAAGDKSLTYSYDANTGEITLQSDGVFRGMKFENSVLSINFMGSWIEMVRVGGSDPEQPSGKTLQLGDNTVLASDSGWQDENFAYTFTATEAGTYVFSVSADSDAFVYDDIASWDAIIDAYVGVTSYSVTLAAGQTIKLYTCSSGSTSYTLTVAKEGANAPQTIADQVVGTWKSEGKYTLVFNKDGTGSITVNGVTETFRWSVSNTADFFGGYDLYITMDNDRGTIRIGDTSFYPDTPEISVNTLHDGEAERYPDSFTKA